MTSGYITEIDAGITIEWKPKHYLHFERLLRLKHHADNQAFSLLGDSGALVYSKRNPKEHSSVGVAMVFCGPSNPREAHVPPSVAG